MEKFQTYNQGLISNGISLELSSLVLIKADKNFINNDIRQKDGNLIPTLKAAVGLS